VIKLRHKNYRSMPLYLSPLPPSSFCTAHVELMLIIRLLPVAPKLVSRPCPISSPP